MRRFRLSWLRAVLGLFATGLLAAQVVAGPWLHHCEAAAPEAAAVADGGAHAGHQQAAGAPAPCDDCHSDCAAGCGLSAPTPAPTLAVAIDPPRPTADAPSPTGFMPVAPDHRLPFPTAPPALAPLS